MKKLIYIFVLLCCVNSPFAFTPVTNNYEIVIGSDFKLTTQTKNENDPNLKLTMAVKYPQLVGSNLSPAAQQFNKDMEEFVNTEMTEFKSKVAEGVHGQVASEGPANKNDFDLTFQAGVFKINDKKLVNVRFNKEYYYAGDAHPTHDVEVYNFDLISGKKLQLSDFFKSDSSYLKVFSDVSSKALKKQLQDADEQMIEKGTAPKMENFVNWILEPDGILIIFDEYQVASYVDGQPEVFVPYKMLKKYILPDALIEPCVKDPKVCSAI
jgi:hypothetical protein